MKNEPQDLLNPSPASLSVVVAYDDVYSGIEAKDIGDLLARQLAPACEIKISLWGLAALQFPELEQMAAEEAKEADLLIVAVNGGECLRPRVKICFSQCHTERRPMSACWSRNSAAF